MTNRCNTIFPKLKILSIKIKFKKLKQKIMFTTTDWESITPYKKEYEKKLKEENEKRKIRTKETNYNNYKKKTLQNDEKSV